jgi:paraquat-inducible protein A
MAETRSPGLSAAAAGLCACHVCGKLHPHPAPLHCACCGASLHARKRYSIQRAWAWLIAALILYIPANIYPIMITEMLGRATPNTIIGGVINLFQHGAYVVAAVVFSASILIPLLKFSAMSYLLISIQRGTLTRRVDRHRLYRYVDFIGRWSMIDVFVVAILVALVQMGGLAQVLPGPAADAFAAVVVCTMFSALALDSRLIWD